MCLHDTEKSLKWLDSLNTFEGLTMRYGCKKTSKSNCEKVTPEILSNTIFPAIFAFEFHESRILEDTFSIFWHFLNYSHFTHHEKLHEKAKIIFFKKYKFFFFNLFLKKK